MEFAYGFTIRSTKRRNPAEITASEPYAEIEVIFLPIVQFFLFHVVRPVVPD